MKKKFMILLTLVLMICLSGCSGSKLNDNNTRTAKAIINATDDYLDGNSSAETAYNLIHSEQANIDKNDENATDEIGFSMDVNGIIMQLIDLIYESDGDVGKIVDYRNDIASLIGESKYKGITGSSDSKDEEEKKETPVFTCDKEGSYAGYTFKYPSDWTPVESDDGRFFYIYPTEDHSDGFVMLSYEETDSGTAASNTVSMAKNILSDDKVKSAILNIEIKDIWDDPAREIIYVQSVNGVDFDVDGFLIANGDKGVMYCATAIPQDADFDFSSVLSSIAVTLEYKGS